MSNTDRPLLEQYADLILNIFSQRVQKFRKERKLSREQLADMVGVSPATIKNIERKQGSVKLDTAFCIAEALQISFSDLLPHPKKYLLNRLEEIEAEAKDIRSITETLD